MAVLMALDNAGTRRRQYKGPQNMRRSPEATATGADSHAVGPRPTNTFAAWWAWGVLQSGNVAVVAPLAIHSQAGDRSGWGNVKRGVPRGLPFSKPFLTHALREREFEKGALSRAASHLFSRSGRQTDEFRIVSALMSGATDPEHVRIVLLGSPHVAYFEECAIRALAFVFDKIDAELATAKDPDAPAGAA